MASAVAQPDVDRYVIVEYLAEGGMGAIYLGKKVGMGGFEKEVVLKQLLPEFTSQPEFIDLFLREAKLSASLDHANIVHTIDLVAAGNDYFIVMEYVRGGDLRALLKRMKRRHATLSPAAALFITREVLNALAYAHSKKAPNGEPLKLIHRDISPSNVMASAAGEVKLADFGIAKVSTHKSVFYRVKGKVGYMSPEQAFVRTIDHRSDLYSLGICMYEMLTNERLFVADLLTLPQQIYNQPIPKLGGLPHMPKGIDGVMRKALALEPDERFQSAEEFLDALVRLAFKNGLVFTGPDLAAELRQKCGEDPTYWNTDEDLPREPDANHPGTEVISAEEALSGVELTSVLTGVSDSRHVDSMSGEDSIAQPIESGRYSAIDSVSTPAQAFSRAAANANDSDAFDTDERTRRLEINRRSLAYANTQFAPDSMDPLFDHSDLPEESSNPSFDSEDEPTEHWIDARQRSRAYEALEKRMTQALDVDSVAISTSVPPKGQDSGVLDAQATRAIGPSHRRRRAVQAPTDHARGVANHQGARATTNDTLESEPAALAFDDTTAVDDKGGNEHSRSVFVDVPSVGELDIENASAPRIAPSDVEPRTTTENTAPGGNLYALSPQEPTRRARKGRLRELAARNDAARPRGNPPIPVDATQRLSAHEVKTSRLQHLAMLLAAAGLLLLSIIIVVVIGFSGPDLPGGTKGDSGAKREDQRKGSRSSASHTPPRAGWRLRVTSTPGGAEVLLDRVKQACSTTCVIAGLRSNHTYLLTVRKPKRVRWSMLLKATGPHLEVHARLRDVPEPSSIGYLNLQVTPSANVLIDDTALGHVTSEGRIPLAPGDHEVLLERPGLDRQKRFKVTVQAGKTVSLEHEL